MKTLPPHNDARAALTAAAKERILVLDGAMGTMIQQLKLRRGRLSRRAVQGLAQGRARQQRPARS